MDERANVERGLGAAAELAPVPTGGARRAAQCEELVRRVEDAMPEGEEEAPPGTRMMALVRWALVALMAVAAVVTTGRYFGMLSEGRPAAHARFHCPMHPAVIQDHPGECPICGMDLVLIAAGESAAPRTTAATAAEAGHAGHRHDPNDAWFCPMHPRETGTGPSDPRCPVCGMKLTRREPGAPAPVAMGALPAGHEGHRHDPHDAWYCPMHPEETSPDSAGRCPVCGMVPRVRDEKEAAPRTLAAPPSGLVPVDLSPERVQLIGMRTAGVERARLAAAIHTVGALATSEEGLSRIATRFSGWIEQLQVSQTGERVERGQVLASIYSPELLVAQQEYLDARRWASPNGGGAASLLEDARQKLGLMGVSAPEIAEIERAGKPIRALKLRSPARGYVVQRSAEQGLYVQTGTELFQVADLSRVWLLAEVHEYEAGRVRVGQSARLQLAAYPGEAFEGKVQFVYPVLDSETRTLKLRIGLRNPDLKLKPGMYGDVTIAAQQSEGLVVPREALVDTGREQYVFVARPNGRFEPRKVTTGLRAGESVEVLDGLSEGDTVVTTGNFLIDSESRLRAAIEGLGGGAASTAEAR